VSIYQLSLTLPIKATKTELSDMQGCLQLPLPQVEKDWAMAVRWQESREKDIMITIRLSSHPNFPDTSFKASLRDTTAYLVECYCCKNPGLRPDFVSLKYVLDKETRETRMVRHLQTRKCSDFELVPPCKPKVYC